MLKRIIRLVVFKNNCLRCGFSQEAQKIPNTQEISNETSLVENDKNNVRKSVFEPLSEDISHVSTYLKPTFNFAAYANKSETIQELVKLGVDLHRIEKNVEAIPYVLGLKFEDIKEHIIFFNDLGLNNEEIGVLISKNPFIFKEDLKDLDVRVNYLKFKKFTDEMILRIVTRNAFWLNYSTQEIDRRMGFFQKNFYLSGNQVRLVAVSKPRLITYNLDKVKVNIFAVKEEMGFSQEEISEIILKRPSIFTTDHNKLLKTFEYLHNVMNMSLERLVQTPEILTCRANRLRQRHEFLVKLEKDQFDPTKPNYVGLTTLVLGTDAYFATEVAKSSVQTFNLFLKTL